MRSLRASAPEDAPWHEHAYVEVCRWDSPPIRRGLLRRVVVTTREHECPVANCPRPAYASYAERDA